MIVRWALCISLLLLAVLEALRTNWGDWFSLFVVLFAQIGILVTVIWPYLLKRSMLLMYGQRIAADENPVVRSIAAFAYLAIYCLLLVQDR